MCLCESMLFCVYNNILCRTSIGSLVLFNFHTLLFGLSLFLFVEVLNVSQPVTVPQGVWTSPSMTVGRRQSASSPRIRISRSPIFWNSSAPVSLVRLKIEGIKEAAHQLSFDPSCLSIVGWLVWWLISLSYFLRKHLFNN